MSIKPAVNVFGSPLEICSTSPMTGFFRDGYCNTNNQDYGSHVLAAKVSDEFLSFSASRGNDLRPILKQDCKWCLCVSRWKESLDAYKRGELSKEGVPKVILPATHQAALKTVTLEDLQAFSLDKSESSSNSKVEL